LSFLDQLKRQADALRSRRSAEEEALWQRLRAVEDACRLAHRYCSTLAEQLQVIQPRSAAEYRLDRQHVFRALPMSDFYADARMSTEPGRELYDHVVLHWQCKTGQSLQLVKDFPNDIEQLEARLRQGSVMFDADPIRNPDDGKLIEVRYALVADFRAGVRFNPRHEQAEIEVVLHNLDRLESLSFTLAADALDEARLDALARWITGDPAGETAFLDGAQGLRRSEP
jgi:hypothetical protein